MISIMQTCYNNKQHLNQLMNEETVFPLHSKRNQFLILLTFFCYYCCCTFLGFFSNVCLFFPSKHIKIMFKVSKLILNINIEGKVCSHHTVQFSETEQKPIRYDVNMALGTRFISDSKRYLQRSDFLYNFSNVNTISC